MLNLLRHAPWRRSLRVRFGLWTAGLLLFVLTGLYLFVYGSMRQGLYQNLDSSLRAHALEAATHLAAGSGPLLVTDDRRGTSLSGMAAEGYSLRVIDAEGEVLQAIGPFQDVALPDSAMHSALTGNEILSNVSADSGATLRTFLTPIRRGSEIVGVVAVSKSVETIVVALRRLQRTLLATVPVIVVVVGVLSHRLAGGALAPLNRIQVAAESIYEDDITTRIDLHTSNEDEITRLAESFDKMLDRVAAAVSREREYVAVASHELQSPVTSMEAILDLAQLREGDEASYHETITGLSGETERLRDLVQDLLQLARLDSQTVELSETDISTAIQRAVEWHASAAHQKGLELRVEIPETMAVHGNEDLLERLFSNLISNAVHYTDAGAVIISATLDAGDWSVDVRDTGRGIDPQDLPRLFERFFRSDRTRDVPGTGLGLAIADEIVQAHRGSIQVDSTPGVGSVFRVRLPAAG